MASTSGGGGGICPRECESCRSAPGVPFCRVEWSFLCTGCAGLAHANSWIVVVPPTPNPNPNTNSNPNPNPSPTAFAYPYPFPNPNPLPAAAAVVQLSSDDDEAAAGERRRRRRRRPASVPAEAPGPYERVASVMRYREKRKSRRFDKNVRYEARQAYAELRPRIDGKFTRPESTGDETTTAAPEAEEEKANWDEQLQPEASEVVGAPISGELDPPLPEEVELGAMGSREV